VQLQEYICIDTPTWSGIDVQRSSLHRSAPTGPRRVRSDTCRLKSEKAAVRARDKTRIDTRHSTSNAPRCVVSMDVESFRPLLIDTTPEPSHAE